MEMTSGGLVDPQVPDIFFPASIMQPILFPPNIWVTNLRQCSSSALLSNLQHEKPKMAVRAFASVEPLLNLLVKWTLVKESLKLQGQELLPLFVFKTCVLYLTET